MATLPRAWLVVLVVLVVVVVALATLLVLYSVPMREVRQTEAESFNFTMTQQDSWYYAPHGSPCPSSSGNGCNGQNFFDPPPNLVGPYLAAFAWFSDENETTQFNFWDPFCQVGVWPNLLPEVMYYVNGTHGTFAIYSTTMIGCSEGESNLTYWEPWWDGGPTFDYGGPGSVTVVGALTYTAEVNVPLL